MLAAYWAPTLRTIRPSRASLQNSTLPVDMPIFRQSLLSNSWFMI